MRVYAQQVNQGSHETRKLCMKALWKCKEIYFAHSSQENNLIKPKTECREKTKDMEANRISMVRSKENREMKIMK